MTSHGSADLATSPLAYDSWALDTEETQRPEPTADVSKEADAGLIATPPSRSVANASGRLQWKADPAKPCHLTALPSELLELIARAAVQLPPFRCKVSGESVRRLPVMQLSQTCRRLHEHCKRVFFEEQVFDLCLYETRSGIITQYAIPTSVNKFSRNFFVRLPFDMHALIRKLHIAEHASKQTLTNVWRELFAEGLRMTDCRRLASTDPQLGATSSEIWSDRQREIAIKLLRGCPFQSVTSLTVGLSFVEQFGWLHYLNWKTNWRKRQAVSMPDTDDIETACILLLDMFPAVKAVHIHRRSFVPHPNIIMKYAALVGIDEATSIVESVLQHPEDEDLDPEVLYLARTARTVIGDEKLAIMDRVYRLEKWLIERDSRLADTFTELLTLRKSTPDSFYTRLWSKEIPQVYKRTVPITRDVNGTEIKFVDYSGVRH